MYLIIYSAIGLIIGGLAGYFIGKRRNGESFVNDAERIKSENIAKLTEHLNSLVDGEINNEDVRKFINVSDTTACRYLDDLEKEGLINKLALTVRKYITKRIRKDKICQIQ